MDLAYKIAQVCFIIAYALLAMTYKLRSRKQILVISLASLVAFAAAYAFSEAWSGLAMMGVALIRNVTFILQNKRDKSKKITKIDWIILVVLLLIALVFAIFTYDGWLSLLPVMATMIYTVSVWQKNTRVYRLLGIPTSLLLLGYHIFIRSIFGIILECVLFIAVMVGVVTEKKTNRKKRKIKS